jgi:hypothetical protein
MIAMSQKKIKMSQKTNKNKEKNAIQHYKFENLKSLLSHKSAI